MQLRIVNPVLNRSSCEITPTIPHVADRMARINTELRRERRWRAVDAALFRALLILPLITVAAVVLAEVLLGGSF